VSADDDDADDFEEAEEDTDETDWAPDSDAEGGAGATAEDWEALLGKKDEWEDPFANIVDDGDDDAAEAEGWDGVRWADRLAASLKSQARGEAEERMSSFDAPPAAAAATRPLAPPPTPRLRGRPPLPCVCPCHPTSRHTQGPAAHRTAATTDRCTIA